MPTLLWWGRSDPDYSRNKIILSLFEQLGWQIRFFHPVSSGLGLAQAFLSRLQIPDLIWVPCFRQRDMRAALYWGRRWGRPLVFDPLISAYQKEVYEKQRWGPEEKAAIRLRRWEGELFRRADLVIADTHLHAEFYRRALKVDARKISVIHVGADERMFKPTPLDIGKMPIEVLFYGSFLSLHGPEVIIEAAAIMDRQEIRWTLLGDGDIKSQLQEKAGRLKHVRFEPWIEYERLPQRISRAHIVLGIFGTTPKAAMVIPNKVFQAMALGRPLITRESDAYPGKLISSQVIGWVPPGDAHALARCVGKWVAEPAELTKRAARTRELYMQYFNMDHLMVEIQKALDLIPGLSWH